VRWVGAERLQKGWKKRGKGRINHAVQRECFLPHGKTVGCERKFASCFRMNSLFSGVESGDGAIGVSFFWQEMDTIHPFKFLFGLYTFMNDGLLCDSLDQT
jgi:hypothetical protein